MKPWQWACIVGWITFIAFHFVLGQTIYFTNNSLCLKEYNGPHGWYSSLCFGVSCGFFIIWVILLLRITRRQFRVERLDRSAYISYLNVVSMGLITSILSLTIGWEGLCVDHFGYVSLQICFLYISITHLPLFPGLQPLRSYGGNGLQRVL